MTTSLRNIVLLAVALLGAVGCGEKPQPVTPSRNFVVHKKFQDEHVDYPDGTIFTDCNFTHCTFPKRIAGYEAHHCRFIDCMGKWMGQVDNPWSVVENSVWAGDFDGGYPESFTSPAVEAKGGE